MRHINSPFVGREKEIKALNSLLNKKSASLVVIKEGHFRD